jgi:MFS family permease
MAIARIVGQAFSPVAVPNGLRWFYTSVILRRAADALLLVIFPVFLYELGPQVPAIQTIFPGDFESGMATILAVLLLSRISHLAFAVPLSTALQKLGLRKGIIIGQIARFLMLILYSFSGTWPALLIPATALWALVLSWYFPAYHLYLAEKLEVGKIGRELGTLEILIKLALVVTPLIGVLFYTLFGSQDSFLLAATLTLLSTVCLGNIPEIRFRTKWRWSDFWESWKDRSLRQQWIGLAGKTWEEHGLASFLPLFLFLSYQDIVQPGYIFTSASLFSLIVVYLAGWSFDTNKSNRPTLLTGASSGFFWIARFFLAPFPLMFVFAETLERFSSNFFSLSFFARLIQRIRQGNPVLYVHNREALLSLTLVAGALFSFLLLVIGWSWLVLFVSCALAALTSLVFVKKR